MTIEDTHARLTQADVFTRSIRRCKACTARSLSCVASAASPLNRLGFARRTLIRCRRRSVYSRLYSSSPRPVNLRHPFSYQVLDDGGGQQGAWGQRSVGFVMA